MTGHRFSHSSFFNHTNRKLFFLVGNTSDSLCTPSLELLNLPEALHRHLIELGYDRILFYTRRQGVYFYDRRSRELIRPSANEQQSSNQINRRTKVKGGPLGRSRVLRRNTQRSSVTPADDNERLQLTMSDLQMVGLFHRCMMESHLKTAIVFPNGLEFITSLDTEVRNQLAGDMQQWGYTHSNNTNICLFVFPRSMDLSTIDLLTSTDVRWSLIRSQMFEFKQDVPILSEQTVTIGQPREVEIAHLIHRHRVMRPCELDWQSMDEILPKLTRYVVENEVSLKDIDQQLHYFERFGDTSLYTLLGETGKRGALSAIEKLCARRGAEKIAKKVGDMIVHAQEVRNPIVTQQPTTCSTPPRLRPCTNALKKAANYNMILTGAPGTGKTTSARLIAEAFADAGLLDTGQFITATRQELVAGYIGQTAINTAQKVEQALGGVLFVDEAYTLADEDFGCEAIETIMESITRYENELIVILAGYEDPMNDFLDVNEGLSRRFPKANRIHIDDFEPDLLVHIFLEQIQQNERQLSDDLANQIDTFFTNWHASRNPMNFGNAGDVINLFQNIDQNRVSRVKYLEMDDTSRFTIVQDDIPEDLQHHLTPKETATAENIQDHFGSLVGLNKVKAFITSRIGEIRSDQERIKRGLPCDELVPGAYLFVGNPGTGKTTIAKQFGEILCSLNLLPRAHVEESTPSQLREGIVGEAEKKLEQLFKKAEGGVLFFDEAHQFADDQTGRQLVKSMLTLMADYRERLCIICVTYPGELDTFLDIDPGLRRRFEHRLDFEDFDEHELLEIFERKIQQNQDILDPHARDELKRLFEMWCIDRDENFGNAGEVGKLYRAMKIQRATRNQNPEQLPSETLRTFLAEDIPATQRQRIGNAPRGPKEVMAELNQMIGLDGVKQRIETIWQRMEISRMRNPDLKLAPGHYVFSGNPGTGKTTVARMMGQLLHSMGLLKKGHVVEVNREKLVAEYVGQTAPKTQQRLLEALDGILFIDEAYALRKGDQDTFGQEASDQILKFMEDHRDRIAIVFAGYPEPMKRFFAQNPGFESRLSHTINFPDYTNHQLWEIFESMMVRQNMQLVPNIKHLVLNVFSTWKRNEHFGNGRDVRKFVDKVLDQQASRLMEADVKNNDPRLSIIENEDVSVL